ncbi:GDP-mannose 4,6-dehydratase [Alphaproteobacteria bacterium]|nr:GDP-mannose 4,6-dehydratase [Alphaproteobacteria bacterium]
MTKLLILGANSYIGSKFINKYIEKFQYISLCYHNNSENIDNLKKYKNITFNKVDALNFDKISLIVENFTPDIIINFSGYSSSEKSQLEIDRCYSLNIVIALNLIKIANLFPKIKIFNINTYLCLQETLSFDKNSGPYVKSKFIADQLFNENHSNIQQIYLNNTESIYREDKFLVGKLINYFKENSGLPLELYNLNIYRNFNYLGDVIDNVYEIVLKTDNKKIYIFPSLSIRLDELVNSFFLYNSKSIKWQFEGNNIIGLNQLTNKVEVRGLFLNDDLHSQNISIDPDKIHIFKSKSYDADNFIRTLYKNE